MKMFNLSSKAKAFVAVFILMATSLQAATSSSQLPNLDGKASNEIPQDLISQDLHEKKSSELDALECSTEGCEAVSTLFTNLMELSKSAEKEHRALEQAFLDVDFENICTTEVLLNQSKISEKREQLKHLLTFLTECESRLEKMLSDLKWQALSNTDLDEDFRKGFAKGYAQTLEENKSRLQKGYHVKKEIVQAYIKLLDFVSAKIPDVNDNHSGLKSLFKSDEDLKEFQSHVEAIENALKPEEEMALAAEQNREKALNTLSSLINPKKSIAFIRIGELYKEKVELYNQACAKIDWHNIYTEAVLSNSEKITEKKKELEKLCPILDEMEKKWEKEIPDTMHQTATSSCQNNQDRKILEEFITTVSPLEKELVSIRKKYTLEYLQLLNFFSVRYGKYKVNNDEIQFAYEIENKLCESYLNNIKQLLQKEADTTLQVRQLIQKLRE